MNFDGKKLSEEDARAVAKLVLPYCSRPEIAHLLSYWWRDGHSDYLDGAEDAFGRAVVQEGVQGGDRDFGWAPKEVDYAWVDALLASVGLEITRDADDPYCDYCHEHGHVEEEHKGSREEQRTRGI